MKNYKTNENNNNVNDIDNVNEINQIESEDNINNRNKYKVDNKQHPNKNKNKNNKTRYKRKYHYRNEYNIISHTSKRSFKIKDILDTVALLSTNENDFIEPRSYIDIFNMKDKDKWLKAVDEELDNMKRMNVFTIVDKVPKHANVVSTRWVLKYKRDANGKIVKYKAILVAKDYTQVYGIDYKNTFSPTLKQDTLKTIIAITVQNKFDIH